LGRQRMRTLGRRIATDHEEKRLEVMNDKLLDSCTTRKYPGRRVHKDGLEIVQVLAAPGGASLSTALTPHAIFPSLASYHKLGGATGLI